tara:strand:+ start:1794 stop:2291 length:498 start_codon:yes stop_codon:yes gene_type:complete
MKIIGIVGLKNSGKTYLAQKIISKLASQNLKVASIKHAHHDFDIDRPKTDSYLHRKSGSQQVIISSSKRWAKITELKNTTEMKLEDLIKDLVDPDIIIVEGYKNANHPKIEIVKDSDDETRYLFNSLKNVVAIISDKQVANFAKIQFKKNQINEIVNFILNFENE